MMVPAVQLVLDAEVWEVDLLVEVREIVFARPRLDLARVSIRPAVALGIALVVPLKPLLVLAPEIDLQHHALDVGALVS